MAERTPERPILGIDLGTSTSEIAFLREGRPELLQDARGDRIVPSVVRIEADGQVVVGTAARNGTLTYKDRTVQEVKRLMGTGETVRIGGKEYRPEEISALILRHLKTAAESRFGAGTVRDVVISVPARFETPAREATKRAAEMAGLNVVRLINEPTAAAISYGLERLNDEQRVLVFDFGGGTLDVTVLEMMEGVLDVKTSVGDDRLGGKDIDELLIQFFRDKYRERFGTELDPTDVRAAALLKQEAERYKKELSFAPSVLIDMPYLSSMGGLTEVTLPRAEFERMLSPLCERALRLVEEALNRARLNWQQIDVILPVGGSSRIPLFRRELEARWGRPLREYDNPDEAVARGAAIQAGIALEAFGDEGILVLDVSPHRLGTEVVELVGENQFMPEFFSEIIPKDAKLPAIGKGIYSTFHDGQRVARIAIYEATTDSRFCRDHRLIGELEVEDIPNAPAGQPIEVELRYNLDGMVEVTARCLYAPQIEVRKTFSVVGLGNPVERAQARQEIEALWNNSEEVKRCRPLLNQAETMEREHPELAPRIRPVSNALRDALITGDAAAIHRQFEALTDLLFELS